MKQESKLPAEFSSLETWSEWVLADEVARREKCAATGMQEIREFYSAMLESADDVLEHLNTFPINELPDGEQALFYLMLSFIEASMAIEMFEQPEMEYAMEISRFQPAHNEIP